jgi:class 3 adenylate cyclase
VTFLFTDVEGSARLWERDESGMDAALARHDSVVRAAMAAHGGYVFSTAGDSFAVAFATPLEAVLAAVDEV